MHRCNRAHQLSVQRPFVGTCHGHVQSTRLHAHRAVPRHRETERPSVAELHHVGWEQSIQAPLCY